MKTYSIIYSEEAKQDLIDIKSYIKYNLKEPKTAEKLISKIKKHGKKNLRKSLDIASKTLYTN